MNSEPAHKEYDAIVIGSGPNGLAAGIVLAQNGHSVLMVEGRDTIGGGMRTAEVTLPGYHHDICSSAYPMGIASPLFRELPLDQHGLKWVHSEAVVAHVMMDQSAVMIYNSLERTAESLGVDGPGYVKLLNKFLPKIDQLLSDVLAPIGIPKNPFLMSKFGMRGGFSAKFISKLLFRHERTRAMFAGMAAHSVLPLDSFMTGAVGLIFCVTAHGQGWPIVQGGAQKLTDALGSYFKSLGGEIVTNFSVANLKQLPSSKIILFDTSPSGMAQIADDQIPSGYRRSLEKFQYGPGVFKLDWALSDPIPWLAKECQESSTVHVGGTFEEVAESEKMVWGNQPSKKPFLILVQPSLADPSRAPQGKHTAWAYCHVPKGYDVDMTDAIENRIEEYAPGFRDCILKRTPISPSSLAEYNPNNIGGDVTGGAMTLKQVLFRPTRRNYRTPNPKLWLCSASTPPGGGVHGMCGYHAANQALKQIRNPK